MTSIIAIDPGASGGISILSHTGSECSPMPETQGDIVDTLRSIKAVEPDCVCYLEQVGGFTGKGQPGSAMFKFGESFGFLKGVIQTLGFRLVMVRPQVWQKHFGLGTASACASKTEWKNKLKAEAQRRFPHLSVTLKTADSLLILDYAIALEKRNHCED
jgi:hypothetical protein